MVALLHRAPSATNSLGERLASCFCFRAQVMLALARDWSFLNEGAVFSHDLSLSVVAISERQGAGGGGNSLRPGTLLQPVPKAIPLV